MFRSKSFNIPHPIGSGSLTRSKSFSELWLKSIDIRYFIAVREVKASAALNATRMIMKETMLQDWRSSDSFSSEQQSWNARYDESLDIFEGIEENIAGYIADSKNISKLGMVFFVAYFKGVSVGVMQLSMKHKLPHISLLATHCGIRGCGPFLVEYAVNKSQQSGKKGKLKLQPFEKAKPAYMKMGFINKGRNLELDPAKRPDKWIWDKNSKRYTYNFI
ncbi:GNAT family N-acetyltransferase [Xenorhabdus stockiae]|uniref:GNAT family N-acetyltransferase n=1 Tax=Xenorhabdus stockiae TaxID=351614 RepID=UPI003CE9DCCE